MSYENMWREDYCCDFPWCGGNFDTRKGKKVAKVVKDEKGKDKIVAFCAEHCTRLESEGVILRVLKDVHDEMTEARDGPIRRRMEAERIAREKKFIDDLKK